MFLTRMRLNPARRGTRSLLASPQRMHAAVLSAFPPGTTVDGPDGRVLWRADTGQDSSITLYVSSPQRPDLTHVVEQAGWPTEQGAWQTVDSGRLLSRLDVGQEWIFRLAANPVHNVRGSNGARGKRLGHVTVSQQTEWLLSRTEKWGFVVVESSAESAAPQLAVHSRRQVVFDRRTDGAGRSITLSVATFDGTLRVTAPDLLRMAIAQGVGGAKGYGCGLITLAPVR